MFNFPFKSLYFPLSIIRFPFKSDFDGFEFLARQAGFALGFADVTYRFVERQIVAFGRIDENTVDDELGFLQKNVVAVVAVGNRMRARGRISTFICLKTGRFPFGNRRLISQSC